MIQFVKQRERLSQLQQATKKGLLFYGPPGTGKTHTLHYLARALEGHTTLLISAEQVSLLGEYMTLARFLQPSIVVLEDVDLIARDRGDMNSPCEEVLLNKLLNEMDGLKEDADNLRPAIKDKLTSLDENYISFDRYREICRNLGESDLRAQELPAGFLNDLGVAINDRGDPRLCDSRWSLPRNAEKA